MTDRTDGVGTDGQELRAGTGVTGGRATLGTAPETPGRTDAADRTKECTEGEREDEAAQKPSKPPTRPAEP